MELASEDREHIRAAQSYMDQGDFPAAEQELDKLNAAFSSEPEARAVLRVILEDDGRAFDAAAIAKKLLDAHPAHEPSWLRLASCQERKEIVGFAEASATLEDAGARFPQSVEVHFQLARMFAATGQNDEAEIAHAKAVTLAQQQGEEAARALHFRTKEDYFIGRLLWPDS
jgi:predicted Zn-dependent protease